MSNCEKRFKKNNEKQLKKCVNVVKTMKKVGRGGGRREMRGRREGGGVVRRGEWEKGDRRETLADRRRPSKINLNAVAQHTTHNTRQTDIATKRRNRPIQ